MNRIMNSCSRDCDWPAGRDDNITNGSRHQSARRIKLAKRPPPPPITIGAPTHAEGNAVMTTLPQANELRRLLIASPVIASSHRPSGRPALNETAALSPSSWPAKHAPAKAGGRPSTSCDARTKEDVDGGAKPRHDDGAKAAVSC